MIYGIPGYTHTKQNNDCLKSHITTFFFATFPFNFLDLVTASANFLQLIAFHHRRRLHSPIFCTIFQLASIFPLNTFVFYLA